MNMKTHLCQVSKQCQSLSQFAGKSRLLEPLGRPKLQLYLVQQRPHGLRGLKYIKIHSIRTIHKCCMAESNWDHGAGQGERHRKQKPREFPPLLVLHF